MVAKSGFGGTDNLPHTLVWQTLVISCITLINFNWSNHKFVSWHDVWTLFGVVHFAYMCSTRSIYCLFLLCAPLVVNPLLKLLKLDQTCLNAIFRFIWSPWAFASTCMCCYIYTWQHPLEHSFNLLAIILKLLHSRISTFLACFEGKLQFLGSSLISAYVNKGEKFPHSQCHLKLSDMHSFERDCTCSGGVAFEVFC